MRILILVLFVFLGSVRAEKIDEAEKKEYSKKNRSAQKKCVPMSARLKRNAKKIIAVSLIVCDTNGICDDKKIYSMDEKEIVAFRKAIERSTVKREGNCACLPPWYAVLKISFDNGSVLYAQLFADVIRVGTSLQCIKHFSQPGDPSELFFDIDDYDEYSWIYGWIKRYLGPDLREKRLGDLPYGL